MYDQILRDEQKGELYKDLTKTHTEDITQVL